MVKVIVVSWWQRLGILSLIAMVGLSLSWGSPVNAHAALIRTDPPHGSVLTQSPPQIRLSFNQPVQLTDLQLLPSQGAALPLPLSSQRLEEHTLDLPPLPQDDYHVRWRAIALDSHPVNGVWSFRLAGEPQVPPATVPASLPATAPDTASVHAPGADPEPLPPQESDAVGVAMIGVRWSLYACTLGLVGFGLRRRRDLRQQDWVWGVGWVNFSLTLVALALHSAQLYPQFSSSALIHLVGSPLGWAMLARLLGTTLMLAGMSSGAGVLLLSVLPLGHALTSSLPGLTLLLLGLHLGGVAFWLGGLIQIERGWLDPQAITDFSRQATWIVPGLVAAGLGMGLIHHGWIQGWEHPYGLWLSGKVAVTALLLGLAAHNQFRLLPALRQGAPVAGSLRTSVRLELLGIGILFVLSALLVSQAPPVASSLLSHRDIRYGSALQEVDYQSLRRG